MKRSDLPTQGTEFVDEFVIKPNSSIHEPEPQARTDRLDSN
jgi:hypothetical protein